MNKSIKQLILVTHSINLWLGWYIWSIKAHSRLAGHFTGFSRAYRQLTNKVPGKSEIEKAALPPFIESHAEAVQAAVERSIVRSYKKSPAMRWALARICAVVVLYRLST